MALLHLRQRLGRQPRAMVAHAERRLGGGQHLQFHRPLGVMQGVVHQVAQHDGQAVQVPFHPHGGLVLGHQAVQPLAGRVLLPELLGDLLGQLHQVDAPKMRHIAALGTRQLQQPLRAVAQGGQGAQGLAHFVQRHLAGGLGQAAIRHGAVDRRLQAQAHLGQGGAQFMRRIRCQGALDVQGLAQALQQLVHAVPDGAQLQRHVGQLQRLQVAAAARRDLLLQLLQGAQLAPRHHRDHPGQHRQHDQQYQHQADDRALAGLAPLAQRVGQLQPGTGHLVVQAEHAVVVGLVEPSLQGHGKGRGRGRHRAQQHLAVGTTQLQQQGLGVCRAGLGAHQQRLVQGHGLGPVHFQQGGIELAVRTLDQLHVEVVLDFAIHIGGHQGRAQQPDRHHGQGQAAPQPLGQALRARSDRAHSAVRR